MPSLWIASPTQLLQMTAMMMPTMYLVLCTRHTVIRRREPEKGAFYSRQIATIPAVRDVMQVFPLSLEECQASRRVKPLIKGDFG